MSILDRRSTTRRDPTRSWSARVVAWFAPVVPQSRIAVLRTALYLFVLLDIHLFVNDPPTLSRDLALISPSGSNGLSCCRRRLIRWSWFST